MSGLGKLETGVVVGNDFEVVKPLSEGGMGAVYLVKQLSTGHSRALKIMHPQLTASETMRSKFVREAKISAKIESEHIVQVLAAGIDATSSTPWLVMELLRGQDLSTFIQEKGPPSTVLAQEIFRQLGHGLAAAHAVGVIHRDLKPENIFLATSQRSTGDLTVKILDFGIAKIAAEASTRGSMAIGSPFWMAPEQAQAGLEINASTDVWALGLIGYYVLTGKQFWRAAEVDDATPMMVMKELLFDELPRASDRAKELGCGDRLPPEFDEWFGRAVVRDVAKRFPDAATAIAAFQRLFKSANATAPVPIEIDLAPRTTGAGKTSAGDVGDTLPASASSVTQPARPMDLSAENAKPVARPKRPSSAWFFALLAGVGVLGVSLVAILASKKETVSARSSNAAPIPSVSSAAPRLDTSAAGLALLWNRNDAANLPKALSLLREACEGGFQDGCAGVALAEYDDEPGVVHDEQAAYNHLDAACNAGAHLACADQGDALLRGKGVAKNEKRGLDLVTKACNAGTMLGCQNLAAAYSEGLGVSNDKKRAVELYEQACKGNDLFACAELGALYRNGQGAPKDTKRAVELEERACDGGTMWGCTLLSGHYFAGDGVAHDEPRAVTLNQKACDGGDTTGCMNLGTDYTQGWGVTKDQKRGMEIYEKACKDGHTTACVFVGDAYLTGKGVAKDEQRARELYDAACAAGKAWGCTGLGQVYLNGSGIAADRERAIELLQKACKGRGLDTSDPSACTRLAGLGVAP